MMAGRTEEGKKGSRRAASSYRLTAPVVEIDTSTLGFTNGFLLRVPKIFAVGDLGLLDVPAVALVGSREASYAGKKRAEQLARDLVRAGIVVMSGLALGIDAVAHRAAIDHGGRTIAVIGTPVDRAYPSEHADLQRDIYTHHLLLSPFASGKKIYPSDFPERNRVMARLARATVIVEAGDTSGTLHQAAECLALGHPLFIVESVVTNPMLTWPARFVGKPGVTVLRSSSQVVEAVTGACGA